MPKLDLHNITFATHAPVNVTEAFHGALQVDLSIGTLLTLMVLFGTCANFKVLLSYPRNHAKHNPNLLLVLALALNDFIYNALPMPLAAVNVFLRRHLHLDSNLAGRVFCNTCGVVFNATIR